MFSGPKNRLSVVPTTSILEHRITNDPRFCSDSVAIAVAQVLNGVVSFDITELPHLRALRCQEIMAVYEGIRDIPLLIPRIIAFQSTKFTTCDSLVINSGMITFENKVSEMQRAGVFLREMKSGKYYLSNKFR